MDKALDEDSWNAINRDQNDGVREPEKLKYIPLQLQPKLNFHLPRHGLPCQVQIISDSVTYRISAYQTYHVDKKSQEQLKT